MLIEQSSCRSHNLIQQFILTTHSQQKYAQALSAEQKIKETPLLASFWLPLLIGRALVSFWRARQEDKVMNY